MSGNSYVIPVIAGDGIGPEVIAQGRRVLDAAAEAFNFSIEWKEYPFGADHYFRTGNVLTEMDLDEIASHRVIYFGACGDPRVPPGILERGLVIAIRNRCDQFVNLRPVRLLPGVSSPLRNAAPEDIDMVVVRENTEDFYISVGGVFREGAVEGIHQIRRSHCSTEIRISANTTAKAAAYQAGLVTQEGARRVIRYAFELARTRRKRVTSIDKANVLTDIYGLWRQEFSQVAREYPDISANQLLVDAAAMALVLEPSQFDVLVMPNMFGDILSEIGAAIQGGIGFSPAGNINPETGSGMFEPIHGSAPQLKGMNQANPLATIWAGSLMLDFIGETRAAKAVVDSIAKTTAERKVLTRDAGGSSTTSEVGDEVIRHLAKLREAAICD